MLRRWLMTWRVVILLVPILLCGCLVFSLSIDFIRYRRHTVESVEQQITVDNRTRHYRIYVPPTLATTDPVPLLLMLHGGGGDSASAEQITQSEFHPLADAHNFIVVYPDGIDHHWNDGRDLDDTATTENVDDVAFIAALIDHIAEDYPIDRDRVYATGISNGGLMSYRLACDLSDQIAGIAPVAANLSDNLASTCNPTDPVAILIITGMDDTLVPYDGGNVRIFRQVRGHVLSITETTAFWRQQNGCAEVPQFEQLPDRDPDDHTRVRHDTYTNCTSGSALEVYAIEGGGHTWPGGAQYLHWRLVGRTSRDIDATDVIWSFFDAQSTG